MPAQSNHASGCKQSKLQHPTSHSHLGVALSLQPRATCGAPPIHAPPRTPQVVGAPWQPTDTANEGAEGVQLYNHPGVINRFHYVGFVATPRFTPNMISGLGIGGQDSSKHIVSMIQPSLHLERTDRMSAAFAGGCSCLWSEGCTPLSLPSLTSLPPPNGLANAGGQPYHGWHCHGCGPATLGQLCHFGCRRLRHWHPGQPDGTPFPVHVSEEAGGEGCRAAGLEVQDEGDRARRCCWQQGLLDCGVL